MLDSFRAYLHDVGYHQHKHGFPNQSVGLAVGIFKKLAWFKALGPQLDCNTSVSSHLSQNWLRRKSTGTPAVWKHGFLLYPHYWIPINPHCWLLILLHIPLTLIRKPSAPGLASAETAQPPALTPGICSEVWPLLWRWPWLCILNGSCCGKFMMIFCGDTGIYDQQYDIGVYSLDSLHFTTRF